jgi:hypothetical protein
MTEERERLRGALDRVVNGATDLNVNYYESSHGVMLAAARDGQGLLRLYLYKPTAEVFTVPSYVANLSKMDALVGDPVRRGSLSVVTDA